MVILSCHVSIKLPPKISDGQDLGVGVAGDLFPAIGAAGDGADGYEDDLVELVDSSLLAPGVRQLGEVVEKRGRVVEGRRGQCVEADSHGVDFPEEVV